MIEEEAANKRKGQEQTNEAIQEAGTSWEQGKGMGNTKRALKENASGQVVVWKFGVCEKKKKRTDSIPQYLRWTNAVRKKLRNYGEKLLAEWISKFRITGE